MRSCKKTKLGTGTNFGHDVRPKLVPVPNFVLALLLAASAQPQAVPRIGYVYPAGGRQGTTVRVTVGGQFLRGADEAYVSSPGVLASVVEYIRPLDAGELGDTAWFLRELVRRRWSARVMDAAARQDAPDLPDHPWLRDLDEKSPGEVTRLWTSLFDPKKQPNAQIAEQVTIEVTIDPNAPPGDRELRVATAGGLTNPVRFQVGVLPEVSEEDLGATEAVDLPALLNGQIMPGEVDHFRLRARKGLRLVVRLQARRLIPYLADAVPGWFQATMSLRDPHGNDVAYGDDWRFDPDPVLLCTLPEDGVYELEVRDALYRGRDDFVYRIAAGELPFVTQVFPLGAQEGTPTIASIAGWSLLTDKLTLDTAPGGGETRTAEVGQDQGLCSEIPYAVSALPECLEGEPNDTIDKAQQVTLPIIVNGRLGQAGDVDTFRFDGRADEEVVAEVYARRLNSPLDPALRLVDSTGAVVAANDDHDDPEMGLITHQADPYLRARLPQNGTYSIRLCDAQQQGGDAYAYRLRIGPPQPDFAVRLTPSTVNVPPGGSATLTAHAVRKDGFDGDIDVVVIDTPPGFAAGTARIPTGKDSAELKVSALRGAARQLVPLQFEARAQIAGLLVSHPAVPAEDMMQAFAYRQLVPQQVLLVAVPGPRPVPAVWRPLVAGIRRAAEAPVRIPLGGMAEVQVQALPDRQGPALETLRFALSAPPRGVTLRGTTFTGGHVIFTVKADANISQAGESGNLILEAFTEGIRGHDPIQASPNRDRVPGFPVSGKQRLSLGVLPPIPIEVVKP
ncbi:MAG: hypothetical protein FJX75_05420 [Armatimonadetes bacterium]|nr:hypothetical protein [Armatimonadota bacterium]